MNSNEKTLSYLVLETVVQDPQWPESAVSDEFCLRIANAIAKFLEFDNLERAVVAFADDAQVLALNSRFRSKNQPTNVLSFPAPKTGEPGASAVVDGDATFLGDIILARETVLAEAIDQNRAFDHHVAHLIVHGILHLLGYVHQDQATAEDMEALEVDILAILEIENPYTEELIDAG